MCGCLDFALSVLLDGFVAAFVSFVTLSDDDFLG